LADANDAEDAFQATFLVLLRKAATLRGRKETVHWARAMDFVSRRATTHPLAEAIHWIQSLRAMGVRMSVEGGSTSLRSPGRVGCPWQTRSAVVIS
jgi:hypothetical protein